MIAIINWTPLEFIVAVDGTFASLAVLYMFLGVLSTIGEWLERKLIKWWTGKDDPNH